MNMKQIEASQLPLVEALGKFAAGELAPDQMKPFGAPFGIYQQRDGLFMNRVRLTGGEVSLESLRFLAGLLESSGAAFGRLTTRQDLQLHGVHPEAVPEVIRQCSAHGLPFRGGGGDTFRNVTVTPECGIAPDGDFDLLPFARALTDQVFDWELAFHLPRKIKIGFSTRADRGLALRQDLGFIAASGSAEEAGFEVYGGGGFGRESALGVKLFDFLPAAEIHRAARAMIELFSEHGDREHRHQARIRFIVKRLGEEEFRKLYFRYFDKLKDTAFPPLPEAGDAPECRARSVRRAPASSVSGDSREFEAWKQTAVAPTRFGEELVSVTLFVPSGNLEPGEFRQTVEVIEQLGVEAVRFTGGQNILLPVLHVSMLPELYRMLRQLPFDLTFRSFAGQIDCCVGATVCKIGVLDTPRWAVRAGEALDGWFAAHPEERPEKAQELLKLIRLSGCPNSCSSHEAAAFGFQGCKKTIDGKLTECFTLWRNHGYPAAAIGEDSGEVIPAEQMPRRVVELLSALRKRETPAGGQ